MPDDVTRRFNRKKTNIFQNIFFEISNNWNIASSDAGYAFSIPFIDEINNLHRYQAAIIRYPGVDFSSGMVRLTHESIHKIRNINWLNFYSQEILKRHNLNRSSFNSFHVTEAENGLIVRSSDKPEIGDLNHGIHPLAYRKLGAIMSDAINIDFGKPYLRFGPLTDGIEDSRRWATRFCH